MSISPSLLVSLTFVRTIEFSLKSEVRKALINAYKGTVIKPAVMEEV